MTKKSILGEIALVVMGIVAAVSAQSIEPATITAREVHGGGGWKTEGKQQRGAQRWNLDVQRGDDNSLRGRVSVADSPLLAAGNVEGKISGEKVRGTISDDSGTQIATFDGIVTKQGMSGTYVDQTGETGSWSWDGPPPQ